MLSKQIVAVARGRGLFCQYVWSLEKKVSSDVCVLVRANRNTWRCMAMTRSHFHTTTLLLGACCVRCRRRIANVWTLTKIHTEPHTVKVPQMAESITEGTLKQWQKKLGEHVEQDEEVATIETDKVLGM